MNTVFTVHNKIELIDKLISQNDVILDVGFWGQGITMENKAWPHYLLLNKTKDVYGIDLEFDIEKISPENRHKYKKVAAEDFKFDVKFDVIFAGDLIEHLVNPGLFLKNCIENLKPKGRLILTTPNTFNLFNMAGKLTREEPVTNSDHTFYFNRKVINTLLQKCGWEVQTFGFMYTLDYNIKESYKKKILNFIYKFISFFTPKFYETLIVVATPKKQ